MLVIKKKKAIKVTKRACLARRRTPVEAWMGTPDEVDFCPLYIL
jgi:hypothetical protein